MERGHLVAEEDHADPRGGIKVESGVSCGLCGLGSLTNQGASADRPDETKRQRRARLKVRVRREPDSGRTADKPHGEHSTTWGLRGSGGPALGLVRAGGASQSHR